MMREVYGGGTFTVTVGNDTITDFSTTEGDVLI